MMPSLQDIIKDAQEYDISAFHHPGEWALHPDSCKFLGVLIRKYRLKKVLEIGPGYSSIIIANEIKHQADHLLVSIDDSQYYSQIAQQYFVQYNLKANAEFYVFPLRPRIYHKQILLFYAIPQNFWSKFGKFDLVLIDAPHHDFGREAGFYEVFDCLKIGGIAILDDAIRPSMEMHYAKKWQYFFGDAIKMTLLPEIGRGLHIITKLTENPDAREFSKKETFITSLKSVRNFSRVLRYSLLKK